MDTKSISSSATTMQRLVAISQPVPKGNYPVKTASNGIQVSFFGGYSVEILKAGKNSHLQCMECDRVMRDPVKTPCGHRACRQCLEQFMFVSPRAFSEQNCLPCPLCSQGGRSMSIFALNQCQQDQQTLRLADSIKVSHCPVLSRNNEPCTWGSEMPEEYKTLANLYKHEPEHKDIIAFGSLKTYYQKMDNKEHQHAGKKCERISSVCECRVPNELKATSEKSLPGNRLAD